MRVRHRVLAASVATVLLLGGCSAGDSGPRTDDAAASASPRQAEVTVSPSASRGPDEPKPKEPKPEVRPVSVLGLAEHRFEDDQLRLGAVRERTPAYTSYDVTYGCRFPWCGHRGWYDVDHIEPFVPRRDGGPPQQTSTRNLARLCRFHHRVKTHSDWHYQRDPDGILTWTSHSGTSTPSTSTARSRAPERDLP